MAQQGLKNVFTVKVGQVWVHSDRKVWQFPIIIYPSEDDEGGRFTAHCLSMDLLADDDTEEGAFGALLETLEVGFKAAEKHNANIFHKAPQKYWDMLQGAQPLTPELINRLTRTVAKWHNGK